MDIHSYLAQGSRIGVLVLVLTVSGCTLPGPVPATPTDPQPFSSGRSLLGAGVPSSQGVGQRIVDSISASFPSTTTNGPKQASRTRRKRATKTHDGPGPTSQKSTWPSPHPSASPTSEKDNDHDNGVDKDNNKGWDGKGDKKDSKNYVKNNKDSMSDKEGQDDTEVMGDKASGDGQEDKTTKNEEEEEEEHEKEEVHEEEEEEKEEVHEEEDFKTDLLVRLLGLEESRLGVFGWVEANYTANPRVGVDGDNFLLIPNSLANAFVFQQVYLVLEQKIKYRDQIDFGFRVDSLFGAESQNVHDVGLLNKTFAPNTFGYDPVQFYGELHLPIFFPEGIDIRGGRFFALAGYEAATAPGRALFSTSDMFGFGSVPYSQFGVMTTLHITDRLELYNGAVNGWNHWISERNPWSYAGGFNWESEDARTNLMVTLNAGFTQFPRVFPDVINGVPTPPQLITNPRFPDRSSNTTMFSTVLSHKWTDHFTMVIMTDQAIVNHLAPLPLVSGMPQGHASYYGLAGWFLYAFTEKVTGVARAEVFRDNNGLLTGFADNFYESTLGLIYKPVPWLWFRPETRFDWAQFNRPFFTDISSDHYRSNYQFTFGLDAIFIF